MTPPGQVARSRTARVQPSGSIGPIPGRGRASDDELEPLTRVGFERGMRSREGER
jgi:hypothetical protein